MGIEKMRLAEIAVSDGDGYTVCTGYAVRDDLVLTAGHILKRGASAEGKEAQVRFAGEGQGWIKGAIVWGVFDDSLDAALIRLPASIERRPGRVYFGEVPVGEAEWVGGGFAQAARHATLNGSFRDTSGISGRIQPMGGLISGLLDLVVEGGPTDAGKWKGLSGSPVFAGEQLIGMVIISPDDFGGNRLKAISIAWLWKDAGFRTCCEDIYFDSLSGVEGVCGQLEVGLGNDGFLDRSIAASRRKYEKLNTLLSLGKILRGGEGRMFCICLYLYDLKGRAGAGFEDPAFTFSGDELFQGARDLVEYIDATVELEHIEGLFSFARADLLVSLVRLANLIDLDISSVNKPGDDPRGKWSKRDWPAYYVQRIATKENGIMEYLVRLNPEDTGMWERVRYYVGLAFEAFYQYHRFVLTRHGVAVGRSETSFVVTRNAMVIPDEVKAWMEGENEENLKLIQPRFHLGGPGDDGIASIADLMRHQFALERILPLPFTRVCDRLSVPLPGGKDYFLSVGEVQGANYDRWLEHRDGTGVLIPGRTYRWWIEKRNDDFTNVIDSGGVEVLSTEEVVEYAAAIAADGGTACSRLFIDFRFGLYERVLAGIWQKRPEDVSGEDIFMLYRIVQRSIDWVERWNRAAARGNLYADLAIALFGFIERDKNQVYDTK